MELINNLSARPLRILISGSPGSGKTSIVKQLERMGYPVVHEAAREEIKAQQQTPGSNLLPWKDVAGFSSKLKDRILKYAGPQGTAFSDRGLPDVVTYLKRAGVEDLDEYHRALSIVNYHSTVFITPPWRKIYRTDAQRKERFEEALILHNLLLETYEQYGFNIVTLPLDNTEKRCQIILEQCEHLF